MRSSKEGRFSTRVLSLSMEPAAEAEQLKQTLVVGVIFFFCQLPRISQTGGNSSDVYIQTIAQPSLEGCLLSFHLRTGTQRGTAISTLLHGQGQHGRVITMTFILDQFSHRRHSLSDETTFGVISFLRHHGTKSYMRYYQLRDNLCYGFHSVQPFFYFFSSSQFARPAGQSRPFFFFMGCNRVNNHDQNNSS